MMMMFMPMNYGSREREFFLLNIGAAFLWRGGGERMENVIGGALKLKKPIGGITK